MVVMASVGYLHGNVIRQRICGLVQSAGYLILNTVCAVGFVSQERRRPSLVSRFCYIFFVGLKEEEEPYFFLFQDK
jgi:hypothetical protein